jgi:endonuclease/exonuclease/phosphatase (EEP) superfamily protein YafD
MEKMMRKVLLGLSGLYCLVLMIYVILRLLAGDSFWWLSLAHNFMPYCLVPAIFILIGALIGRIRPLAGWAVVIIVIGALWYLPLTVGRPSPPAPSDLVLVTFNAYQHNTNLVDAENWLLLKNPDVIVLQQLNKGLIDMPRLSAAYPHQTERLGVENFAILSRYPITTNGLLNLQNSEQPWITLDFAGRPVTIYTVHLESPLVMLPRLNPPLLAHYDETVRNKQIDDLLAQTSGTPNPYIIAGDFNLNEFSPAYNRVDAVLNDTYRQTRSDFGATWPAGASEELPNIFPVLFRYDYVWYSAGLKPITSEVGPSLGSDHRPVFAVLNLE